MPTKISSNILYTQGFDTSKDIYISFLTENPSSTTGSAGFLQLQTGGNDFLLLQYEDTWTAEEKDQRINLQFDSNVDGIGLFLIDASTPTLTGGGAGNGVGLITDTNNTSFSAVSGMVLSVIYDASGEFSRINSLEQFTTGVDEYRYNSICVRKLDTFDFVGSQIVGELPTLTDSELWKVFRVGITSNLQSVVFYTYQNELFSPIATFNTGLDLATIPSSVKVGITYSGSFHLKVKNITFNGTTI